MIIKKKRSDGVIQRYHVKTIKKKSSLPNGADWRSVFSGDNGTNYPVSVQRDVVSGGSLFQHYGKGFTIHGAKDVFRLMKDIANRDREFLVVLGLNNSNVVVFKEVVSIGTLNSSLVHPREVFKKAILYSCTAIILVHNHPTGGVEPSSEDVKITQVISKSGEFLKIKLLDHVIVGRDSYYSFSEKGRL